MTVSRRSLLRAGAAAIALLVPSVLVASGIANQNSGLQFELYRDGRARFRWRLKSANGRVLATSSEGYNAKADGRSAIERIRNGASTATIEDLS